MNKKEIYLIIIFIIFLGLFYYFFNQYQKTKELLYQEKYKRLQEKVKFLEVENKTYQANMNVIDEKKISELVEKRLSKKMKQLLKKNKEEIINAGKGEFNIPEIKNETKIIKQEAGFLHFEDLNLKFQGKYNFDKKEWNVKYKMKSIPIKFNFLTTETKKEGVPVKHIYIEAIDKNTGKKLTFKNFDVYLNKNIKQPKKKWYKSGKFKFISGLIIGIIITNKVK